MTEEVQSKNQAERQDQETNYKELYEKERASKERILNESKDYKMKAQTSSQRLEELEKARVEEDGNNAEKADYWKNKFEESSEESDSLRSGILVRELKETYRTIAPNCKEVDVVLNDPAYSKDFKAAIDRESLVVDEEILKGIFVKDKERRDWLYKGKKLPDFASGGAEESKGTATRMTQAKEDAMTPDEYKAHVANKYKQKP